MAYIRTRQTKSDGPRYDVRYVVDGERHTDRFRRLEDADARLRKVRADELAGLVLDPRGGERLFDAYATDWLKHRLAKGRPLTPSTRQGYEGLLRRNLRPTFAKTKLRQITPERVRKWQAELIASAGTDAAAKSYRLLRAILNTAVADELIVRNPCNIKGAGIEHAPERPMLATTSVLDLADAIEPRLRMLVMLAGFAGLRPGELLGLQRQDVDIDERVVRVRREAHEITGQGRILTGPKSEAGKRDVALPATVLEGLRDHLERNVSVEPEATVFTRASGRPLRRADLSNAWIKAKEIVGLSGVVPHDLRHHAATLIARNPDVTLKELMATIGHSSPVAALRYQHATAERGRQIANYVDDQIVRASSSGNSAAVRTRVLGAAPSSRPRSRSAKRISEKK